MRTLELSIKGLTEEQLREKRDSRRGPALVTALLIASLIALGKNPAAEVERPAVSVTPEGVDFGAQEIGSSSGVRGFSITSASAQSFRMRVSFGSTRSAAFSYKTDCGALESGESCDVSVLFTPHTVGKHSTRMTVEDENGEVLSRVEVTGVGTPKLDRQPPDGPAEPVPVPPTVRPESEPTAAPRDPVVPEPPDDRAEIRVDRPIVNFEPRQVGSRSEQEQIRLQNPGTARFSAGYVVSGNEGAHFQVSGCDGGRGSFFFGKDCTLYVSFQPNSGGSHDAVINIRETSEGGDPVNDTVLATIGLNGRGLAAEVR